MEQRGTAGVLMHGLGRRLVFSRPRAWFGTRLEAPRLLRGVSIPHDATCLDIATGLGWASAALARLNPSAKIVALEYDGEILPRTRDYLSSHGAANTRLCRADAKHLPFRASTFNLVLCLYGLHHCRGYLETLREIARVLKPDGTFALIDPVRKQEKPSGGHHGTEVLTSRELQHMLGEAGFRSPSLRVSMGRAKALVRKPLS